MTAPLLAVAWFILVMVGGWRSRPLPARTNELAPSAARPSAGAAGPRQVLGGSLRRLAHRPPDPLADRRAGTTAALAVLALVLSPWAAVLVAAAGVGTGRLAASRQRRHHDRSVADELPDVVDLLVLAVGAGLNVSLSVEAVSRFASGQIADALAGVVQDQARGERLAEALARLPDLLGEPARPLVDALVDAERYGTPLAPVLDHLATDVRLHRRRRAEDAARQTPVKLIFPLVLCALPAFALLTVVPLLLSSLRSFAS